MNFCFCNIFTGIGITHKKEPNTYEGKTEVAEKPLRLHCLGILEHWKTSNTDLSNHPGDLLVRNCIIHKSAPSRPT